MAFWSSARRKLCRFAELTTHDRLRLLQAFILLHLITIARRIVSFRRLQSGLAQAFVLRTPRPAPDESDLARAQHLVRLVEISVGHNLFRTSCLDRSLALWSLLRRQGIDADLRIGVRKEGAQFGAHAWIEYQGEVLNDTSDVRERFAALSTPVRDTSR
jgi:hypothetical protein